MNKFLSACDFTGHDRSSIHWYPSDSKALFETNIKSTRNRRALKKLNYTDTSIIYEFNSAGFRDKEFKQNGIAFFGCSFGFGIGVNATDRYTNILENRLKIRCNNLCVPASGSDTTRRILPYWIDKLRPKIVLHHFMFPVRREIIHNDSINLWLPGMRMAKHKVRKLIDEKFVDQKTKENLQSIKNHCVSNNITYIEYKNVYNENGARDLIHPGPKSHIEMANEIHKLILKHLKGDY